MNMRRKIRLCIPQRMRGFLSLAFLTVSMLHSEPGVTCGGGYASDGTVVERGYGTVVAIDQAGGTVTLEHGATPYLLTAGRTRIPVVGPNVLEDAVAAAGNRIWFEIRVSKGNMTIDHIGKASESAPE